MIAQAWKFCHLSFQTKQMKFQRETEEESEALSHLTTETAKLPNWKSNGGAVLA